MTAQLPSREILKQIIETANEIITVNNGTNEDIWESDTATITRLYDRLNDDLASPSVVKALAEFALAAHEQEPVAYMYRDNLHTDARFSLEPRIRNWSPEDISEYEISETPLFSHPAPVPAVPDEMEDNGNPHDEENMAYVGGWNACRTAMQPNVTLTYEGDNHTEHNLGMVNHIGEDTGTDEVKPVTAATVPAGYVLVPVEPTPEILDEFDSIIDYGAEDSKDAWHRLLAAAPKAPDNWIPVSERMPPCETGVLVATEMDGPGDWRMKWATYVPEHPDAINGWFIPGASWTPTHWQPLPEPPKVKP